MSGFLFGSFGIYVWLVCVVFLVSGVEMLFGLVPFKTCPFFGVLFVVLFLSGCWDVRRRRFLFLCLSLSLSGAGEPQTPAGFVFPLVFLRPGRGLRLRPVPLLFLLHQGFAPRLFFFFFRRSVAGSVFFSFLVLVLVGFFGGGCWSVCVSGFWCVRVRLFAKHVCIR